MGIPSRGRERAHAPWLFLALTLAWTWPLWGLAGLVADDWLTGPSLVLFALGGLGPLLVAAALVALGYAGQSPAAFWRRALDPRVLPARWWVVVLGLALLPPLLVRMAGRGADEALLAPGAVAFLVVGALAGAAEEPGWRGYAQHGLQERMSVLSASLVVGVAWAGWHLPLFWIEGTYQHGLGVLTPAFVSFHLAILVGTVIYAWLYNATGGATVAAVAYHGLGNLANELLPADGAEHLAVGLQAVLALALVTAAWRWILAPRRLDAARPVDGGTGPPGA